MGWVGGEDAPIERWWGGWGEIDGRGGRYRGYLVSCKTILGDLEQTIVVMVDDEVHDAILENKGWRAAFIGKHSVLLVGLCDEI